MADNRDKDLKWWLAPENRDALHARLDELRIKAFRERDVQAGPPDLIALLPYDFDEGEAAWEAELMRVAQSPYAPITNPGPLEARFLEQHPDWVHIHPWRLMGARSADMRRQGNRERS